MVSERSLPRPPIDANLNDEMSEVPSGSDDGHAKGGGSERGDKVSKMRRHWTNESKESLIQDKGKTKAHTASDPSAKKPSSLPLTGSGSSESGSWASPARFSLSAAAKLEADGNAEGRRMLVFDVKDTGIGVTDELKPRLFRAFTQLQSMQSTGALQRNCAIV